MIRLAPVYFTGRMDRTVDFLTALGFDIEAKHRNSAWTELGAPNAQLNLHGMSTDGSDRFPGQTELSFESDEAPSAVAERLTAAGFDDAEILDETFGHSLRVSGPDGTIVQINFSDRTLYV
jgi:hypothetical protein